MPKVFGATFDTIRLLGLAFLAALFLFLVWKVIGIAVPDAQPPIVTKADIYEAVRHDDSIRNASAQKRFDSLKLLNRSLQDALLQQQYAIQNEFDSFYLKQHKNEHKINEVGSLSDSDLHDFFRRRYGSK